MGIAAVQGAPSNLKNENVTIFIIDFEECSIACGHVWKAGDYTNEDSLTNRPKAKGIKWCMGQVTHVRYKE